MDLKIVSAQCKISTLGTQYGGDEVVSRAILGWLFNRESGRLKIAVTNREGNKKHLAVLTLKQIRGLWKSRIDPKVLNGDVTIHVSIEKVI